MFSYSRINETLTALREELEEDPTWQKVRPANWAKLKKGSKDEPKGSPRVVKFKSLLHKPNESVDAEEDTVDEAGKKWIQKAIKHPGALHKQIGVPAGKKIPVSKLTKAAHAGGKKGKRARLALTLKKLSHRR